jgi:hypothetical protein
MMKPGDIFAYPSSPRAWYLCIGVEELGYNNIWVTCALFRSDVNARIYEVQMKAHDPEHFNGAKIVFSSCPQNIQR